MKVCFAPDYREGVPYQQLLAKALASCQVKVEFMRGYRRVFPLARGLAQMPVDLLHLHWPEAYYPSRGDYCDGLRRLRFPFDLAMALRRCPMVLTAHNHLPHDRENEPGVRTNVRTAYRAASAVIFHSSAARKKIMDAYRLEDRRCHLLPPGDLGVHYGEPMPQSLARQRLDLTSDRIVLMFGRAAPYKGIEEAIDQWQLVSADAQLLIVGQPASPEYGHELLARAGGHPRIHFQFDWLTDKALIAWLSAADCVLFNYRSILNSGGAALARSWGVPILLPTRLDTVELEEPNPLVFRFADWKDDFPKKLARALETKRDYEGAAEWRKNNAWPEIASATAAIYTQCLEQARNG
jgi:beta-1,4-mannosyltransferase